MNNAEQYFQTQKQNPEFIENYNQISEQIDIEWELERVKNSYTKKVKKQISIKIENDTIVYFKNLALKVGIPYQNLTNCAIKQVGPCC